MRRRAPPASASVGAVASALVGHRRSARSAPVAGIDIGSTAVRVAFVHDDGERVRLVAQEREAVPAGAVVRGVVRDAGAVSEAVRAALTRAESTAARAPSQLLLAIGGDDLRTYHSTARALRPSHVSLQPADVERTARDAARRATQGAVAVFTDEPGLRGTGLQALQPIATSTILDGRLVDAARGQRGSVLDVGAVAAVLPAIQVSTAEIALRPLRRALSFVAAPVALASLLAEAGITDALVVDAGAELTGVAVIRDGAVIGARSLSLVPTESGRQQKPERLDEVAIWARCIVLAARVVAGDEALPPRLVLSGGAAQVEGVADALVRALNSERRAADARAEPLSPQWFSKIVDSSALRPEYVVAFAAARTGLRS
jgi:cell division ATPase FtsA